MSDQPNHHIEVDVKSMQVWLWDVGPQEPEPPEKPDAPKGADGDLEHELAKIEFAEQLEEYAAALKRYRAARADWKKWHETNGGPIKVQFWSVDATDAKQRDPKRYLDRLPRGLKPGEAHQRNLDRLQQIAADHASAASRDPYFGKAVQGAPG